MNPYEFVEFDGGITDKDIPGATNRYAIADNLLIDYDKKLFQRDGFDIYKSTAYQLGAAERVARLTNFDIDTEIIAFQNKRAFSDISNAWAELFGPIVVVRTCALTSGSPVLLVGDTTGIFPGMLASGVGVAPIGSGVIVLSVVANTSFTLAQNASATGNKSISFSAPAFNTNTAASIVGEAQWQHHLFASSDSGDPVIKIYRDGSSNLQLRSAGLPEWTTTLTPTDGGLALAIALVNDIRTQMLAHFAANGATVGIPNNSSTGHHLADAGGVLAGQHTAVAATVAASDLPTLITLINALRIQYNAHIGDAQLEDPIPSPAVLGYPTPRLYHMKPDPAGISTSYEPFMAVTSTANTANQPLYMYRHYLNFSLADPGFAFSGSALIADILPYLNDLRNKWNWHTFASMTHYNAATWQGSANYTNLGLHATAVAEVKPYTWANITPNYGPFTQFVTDLKKEFDAHRINDMHMEHDTTWTVPAGVSSTPTTFFDAITLLGWLSHCITYHALEPDLNFCRDGGAGILQHGGSVGVGAATLTLTAVSFATDLFKFQRVVPIVGLGTTPFGWHIYDCFDNTKLYNITGNTNASPCVITCANNFTGNESDKQFLITSLHYHLGYTSYYTTPLFEHRTFCNLFDNQDFLLKSAASLQGFADLAKDLASYLQNHTLDRTTAVPTTANYKLKKNSQEYAIYQNGLATFNASGDLVIVHGGMDNVNYAAYGGLGGLYLKLNSALTSTNTAATQLPEDRFAEAPQAASFNYKGVFRYDYTVGTKSFTDRSAPSTAINAIGFLNEDSGGATEIGKYAATFSNLYAFANAANENWDILSTTVFRKEIYRTLGNGQTYYKVDVNNVGGDVPNSTTSFFDVSTDTFLADQLSLYSNDNAPENNRPPAASQVHVFGNVMYYVLGNRVYQSIPNDPDSVPGDFFEEFEEPILGVSSTRSVAVAFGRSRVYRLIGLFDDLGRGSLTYERIFDRTGTISAQSIVKADNGIFFAGKDGFYFTDGYQCMRVTDLEKTFRNYTNSAAKQNNIQGAYDNISKRVYWTVQTGAGPNPDKIWVLDLKFGIKPDATPVTTITKTSGFNPTALTYFNGQIYYGDGDGYTFVQTIGRNIDLVKTTSAAASSWDAEAIRWDLKSCHSNYGSMVDRKYYQKIVAQFEQQATNLSVTITSDADKGRVTGSLPVIRSRKLSDWGDSKIDWIASVYTPQAGNIIDEWRRFNGDGSLRSNYRSIEMATAYCNILASKDMGTATIANVAGNVYSVTLTSLIATRKWPLYSVGYFFRLSGVDYPITVRTSDSVIRFDSTGLATPATGLQATWELWGYPKNEKARILGYAVKVESDDQLQTSSHGTAATGGQNT